jgi:hypothetical protein
MKHWKLIVCLLSLVFFVMAGTACQQSGAAKSAELRGALQQEEDGNGLYIRSGGKRYHIESQQDLSSMVGKFVTLNGDISEKDGKSTIVVSEVKEQ